MTETYFEVRDQTLPDREPLSVTTGYDHAMRAVTALQQDFWAQLEANGEGGRDARLRLIVLELGPGQGPQLRAVVVASG